ncbi:MAG: Mth938-like domain-containing protein [Wolbachia endosymbiont of Tyrophagus putrescentiae]|nr:Mth938-like domain-containing protein [Wolbachia endosymbiont of Tyrophagus putrescentiae]
MDITPIVPHNRNLINGYGNGKFLVNNKEYYGSIVIFPENVITVNEIDINNPEHFADFLTEEVEVLLIGTGKTRSIPNASVKSYLIKMNFEFMTTDAACRTHNVLISEDRFVVTYLLAI